MQKKLSEIDSLYANIICKLSKQIRLKYCETVVDKVASEIIKNKNNFENGMLEEWIKTLEAVRRETKKINEENVPTISSCHPS